MDTHARALRRNLRGRVCVKKKKVCIFLYPIVACGYETGAHKRLQAYYYHENLSSPILKLLLVPYFLHNATAASPENFDSYDFPIGFHRAIWPPSKYQPYRHRPEVRNKADDDSWRNLRLIFIFNSKKIAFA